MLMLLFLLFFFFLFFCQSAEDRITAGTDTCCDAPAVHPSPLRVDAAENFVLVLLTLLLFLFLLVLFVLFLLLSCVVSLLEKVEKRVVIVDLQEMDWIMGEICEVGSVSEMGLLHFMRLVRTGMI